MADVAKRIAADGRHAQRLQVLVQGGIEAQRGVALGRPMAMGDITVKQTVVFALAIGGLGMAILYHLVNPLTMWLTFVTFVGYA